MTTSAYALAVEIRRFAKAGGWPVEDLAAPAQAEMEKRGLPADLPDPVTALWDNYSEFYHPESVWRCDNCGISGSEEHRPRIGMMSFYDERGLLHFCDACAV